MPIDYCHDIRPDVTEVAELYRAAPLIRPVDDLRRITQMLKDANVFITAWHGERLVGILRGWTDGAYSGYICDLAVHPEFQGQDIGQSLLELVCQRWPQVQFILQASKIATNYYRHLGWQKIENGWFWPRSD